MIITFYSDDARWTDSFASRITEALESWGYHILHIDLLPGSAERFHGTGRGLGDMLADFANGQVIDVADYYFERALFRNIRILRGPAEEVDWADLYTSGFAGFLDACREAWLLDHDFVIVSAPPGQGDSTGIALTQLPDVLVPRVGSGLVDLVERVSTARNRLPFDQPRLQVVPMDSWDTPPDVMARITSSWIPRQTRAYETILPMLNKDSGRRLAFLLANRLSGVERLFSEPSQLAKLVPRPGIPTLDEMLASDFREQLLELTRTSRDIQEWEHVNAQLIAAGVAALRGDRSQLSSALDVLTEHPEPPAQPRRIPQTTAVLVAALGRFLRV